MHNKRGTGWTEIARRLEDGYCIKVDLVVLVNYPFDLEESKRGMKLAKRILVSLESPFLYDNGQFYEKIEKLEVMCKGVRNTTNQNGFRDP